MQQRRHEFRLSPRAASVRRSPHRKPLLTSLGAAVLAIGLAACGSDQTQQGTGPSSIPAAKVVEQNLITNTPDTVHVPDLNDPALRNQFVCSFADGYFT